jgi:hypothetical protein
VTHWLTPPSEREHESADSVATAPGGHCGRTCTPAPPGQLHHTASGHHRSERKTQAPGVGEALAVSASSTAAASTAPSSFPPHAAKATRATSPSLIQPIIVSLSQGRPPSFHVPRWDAIRAICRHLAARHRHLRAHPARRRSRRACSSGTAPSGRRGSRPDSRASISLRATAPVPSPACSTRPRSCGWGPRRPRAEEERCLEVWRYEVARRCQSVAAEPLGRELET